MSRDFGAVIRALPGWITLEVERGTLFLLVPVFLSAGAIVYFRLGAEPPAVWIGAALLLSLAAWRLCGDRVAGRHAALAVALIVAGVGLAKIETWRAGTAMLASEVSTRVTGRVVSIEHRPGGRVRLTLDVLGTEAPKLRFPPQRVRVSMRKSLDGLQAGATLTGLVRLQPPPGPVMPGGYDFSFRSYFEGIGAGGFFLGMPDVVASDPEESPRFAARIENARQAIAARIRDRIGGPEGEIAAALMVGVRAGIPEAESEALRRSGLYHIISISGLHMALVAGAVMAVIRLAGAAVPSFSARWPVKKLAAFAALLAIAAYLTVSGGEVAAQRSFIMLAVMLVAVLFDRAALTMRNLAVSAVVVLVISPHEVMGPSFQMSFAATAALVAAYALWTARAAVGPPSAFAPLRVAGRVGRGIGGLALGSLVAGLATAVFGVYHFHTVSPLGLPANLAATPIVSLVIVPSAMAAAVAMPFGVDGPLLDAMGIGIAALLAVARWMAELTPVTEVGLVPGLSVLLLTLGLLAATMATTPLRWAAALFVLPGLLLLGTANAPTVLVSEDAALVGVVAAPGPLTVNLPRGNAFSLNVWRRATRADSLLRPSGDGSEAMAMEDARGPDAEGEAAAPVSERAAGREVRRASRSNDVQPAAGFACDAQTCRTTLSGLGVVVVTTDRDAALAACAHAAVIVLDATPALTRCARRQVAVISRRDLARNGSAGVYRAASHAGTGLEIVYAVAETRRRPWHRHRDFSRAARDLDQRRPHGRDRDMPAASPDTLARPAAGLPAPTSSESPTGGEP